MKRRSNRPVVFILATLLIVVLLLYGALFVGYQQSASGSQTRAYLEATTLYATELATRTR